MKSLCYFPENEDAVAQWTSLADQTGLSCLYCPTLPDEKRIMSLGKERVLFVTTEKHAQFAQDLTVNHENIFPVIVSQSARKNPFDLNFDACGLNAYLTFAGLQTKTPALSVLASFVSHHSRPTLGHYLKAEHTLQTRIIRSPEDKESVLSEVEAILKAVSQNNEVYLGESGTLHPVVLCLDELIINAIFDANTRLVKAPRNKRWELTKNEQINVSWGWDASRFGICVSDPFGTLERDTAFDYLTSSDPKNVLKRPSGGLGFKTLFTNANELFFSVKPDKFTDVFCFWSTQYRSQKMRQSDRTLLFLSHT